MKPFNNLILASNSPRRSQLLSEAGFNFKVFTLPDLPEDFPSTMDVSKVAEFLALKKNKPYREHFEEEIVITADTVVIYDNEILGKPTTLDEARSVIRALSGQKHLVMSGVCISSPSHISSFSSTTEVKFHALNDEMIDHYVRNWPPLDKAGSYGIQEWIGLVGVEWIKGSYFNVMGLPVDKVYQCLMQEFADAVE